MKSPQKPNAIKCSPTLRQSQSCKKLLKDSHKRLLTKTENDSEHMDADPDEEIPIKTPFPKQKKIVKQDSVVRINRDFQHKGDKNQQPQVLRTSPEPLKRSNDVVSLKQAPIGSLGPNETHNSSNYFVTP